MTLITRKMHKFIFYTVSLYVLINIKIHAIEACDITALTNKMAAKSYLKNEKDARDWKRVKVCLKNIIGGIGMVGIVKDIAELPIYGSDDGAHTADVVLNYLKSKNGPAATCVIQGVGGLTNKSVQELAMLWLETMACYHKKHGELPPNVEL